MKTILIYDGTFDGFLTAVYHVFEKQLKDVEIVKPKHYHPDIFIQSEDIVTDTKKAKRVWHGIQIKVTRSIANRMYASFLSEIKGVENVLLRYILYAYCSESFTHSDYSNKDILRVAQVSKMVFRERERMEAIVKFQLTKDGIYFANIEPDFNVLPLLISHFKKKHNDQKWLIYDQKRKQAAYYDLRTISVIDLELPVAYKSNKQSLEVMITHGMLKLNETFKTLRKNVDGISLLKQPSPSYA